MRSDRSLYRLIFAIAFAIAIPLLILGQGSQPITSVQQRSVNLSFIVVDSSNHSLNDIQKDEIRVFENKLPQTISSFSKTDKSVDYGIAIDTSGSFKSLLPVVIQAVQRLVENQPLNDQCFIERFISSDKIETMQEFTSDKAALLEPLPSLKIGGGQSAVIDAIYLAIKHIAERPSDPQRRRALVLFTDGEDRASFYSQAQLLRLLRGTDVQLFIIGLMGELNNQRGLIRPSPREKARDFLETIARETGGRLFFPSKNEELSEALEQTFHDLHVQYEISYQTTDLRPDNFRPVRIEVVESLSRQKITVITRPGYYLTPPELGTKDKKKTKEP